LTAAAAGVNSVDARTHGVVGSPLTRDWFAVLREGSASKRLAIADPSALVATDAGGGAAPAEVLPAGEPGGRADVVELSDQGPAARISLLDGRAGGTIWSRKIAGGYALEQFRRGGQQRLTFAVYSALFEGQASPDGSYVAEEQDTITAVDGRSGRIVWSRSSTGTETYAAASQAIGAGFVTDVVEPSGVLHQASGDTLLAVTVSTSGLQANVTPVAISGTTGTTAFIGEPTSGEWGVVVSPLGDVTGDASSDYLVVADNDGQVMPSTVSADSGHDGRVLWSRGFASDDLSAMPGVRLQGNEHSDVLLRVDDGAGGLIEAMDGRTGQTRWERSGFDAIPLWSSRAQGLTHVAVLASDAEERQLTVRVLRASGTLLWVRRLATRCRGAEDLWYASVGDVDGDGYQEPLINRLCARNGVDRSFSDAFIGPHGHAVAQPYVSVTPPQEPLERHLDLVFAERFGTHLRLLAHDVRNGRHLWTTVLPPRSAVSSVAYGSFIRKGNQILLCTYGANPRVTVLSGRTGRVIWSRVPA